MKADDTLVERSIDDPVRVLMARAKHVRGLALRLQRLRHELHEAVEGREFSAGAIHGSFRVGNLLISRLQLAWERRNVRRLLEPA